VKELFDAAVSRPQAEAETFLSDACGGDAGLYNAVQQMLNADRRGGMLDRSPLAVALVTGESLPTVSMPEADWQLQRPRESPAFPAEAPHLISGRYEILERVGAGGMGEVYRARDWLTGTIIALKRISGAGSSSVSEAGSSGAEELCQAKEGSPRHQLSSATLHSRRVALAHEFRVLASLRHPNIISVLDYGFAADGNPFFTMTLLEGAQQLAAAAAGETFAHRVDLLFQILQALCYLHRHGILHRDLKPSNILVVDKRVTVLDFGISGLSSGKLAGTPVYMAPELWKGGRPTRATDLYAFGKVAFEVLTGKSAQQPKLALLKETAPVRDVVERLLQPDPAERYGDANEVLRDLAEAAGLPPAETVRHRESYLQAAPLVGRRKELFHLMRALRAASRGAGGCVLLAGESGVGKTRLIEELRARALVRGALVLSARAEELPTVPYALFCTAALRLALLVQPGDAQAAVLKRVFPGVEKVLRREIPDLDGDPQSVSERLEQTIADLFRSYGKPILLAVEDCHNLAEELAILRRLTSAAAKLPLLILGSYRSDERPSLPAELPEAAVLHVGRLNGAEVKAMSVAMLGGSLGGNQTLVNLLERETEGNAFFLVEAVRALAEERGSLAAVSPEALPGKVFARGIQDTVKRRLERAPAWARTHLQLAAILGREIDPAVLAEAGVGRDIEPFLQICDRLAILEGHGGHWRFTHEKVRDGALQDVDPGTRAALHRRVASTIEYRSGGDPDWFPVLAFHWLEGGLVEKATPYTLRTAGQTLSLGLPEKAVDLLLEGLRTLGEPLPSDIGLLRESIGQEAAQLAEMLAGRSSEQLLELPAMTDRRIEQIVQMLKLIQPAAHISQRAELFALSALKCMARTLEFGVGPWAAEVFATYAVVLRGMTQNSAAAERFVQLAAHYDRKSLGRLSGPVAFLDAWFVHHWLHPVKENLALALEGAASAAADGDTLYHGFSASSYVMYLAASGAPLREVVEAADRQMAAISGRVRVAAFHCLLERQFALALAGGTQHRLSLSDAAWDEERDLASICSTTNFNQIPYYYLARLRLHYYYREYAKAVEYGERAAPLLPAFRGQILEWMLSFYHALSLLGLARTTAESERSRSLAEARPLADKLEAWAADNPEGFRHLSDLVRAEQARLEGNDGMAAAFYTQAKSRASARALTHELALARELAAEFYLERGDTARSHLEAQAALEAYKFWGAETKASWLAEMFGGENART
jgi:hypothetical protein